MNRRHFFTTSLGALAVSTSPLSAMEPLKRPGKPRLELGVAAYSFGKYFKYMRDKEQKAQPGHEPWSMLDFVDWCADHGVPGAEVTSYYFPPNVDAKFLLDLRHRAFIRGVQLTGTAIGNTWALPKGDKLNEQIAYTKQWIDYCAIMGAPHIRVFAGGPPKGMDFEEAMTNCIATYQECLDYAATKGIFLGMENHHGLVTEPDNFLRIMKGVNSPWAGINWDSGNFNTEDPYADLEKIAPYAVNVQLKMEIKRKGAAKSEPSDLPRVIKILKDANYQGWFTLEYEVDADPFVEIPKILATLRPMIA